MAIEHGIWRIADQPQKLIPIVLNSEDLLEEQIAKDISILSDGWLLIGRQVRTAYDKLIDLLAVDASGSLIIIELKKNKTPRDVVAQAIDYASWAADLETSAISQIYTNFANGNNLKEKTLDDAFEKKFRIHLSSVGLNESHQMVIVAGELDASTERIITYLNNQFDVPVNAVFFKVFEDGGHRYLSRAWMIDPAETQERAVSSSGDKEVWNGEYYVSFGEDGNRCWEDAVKYGFISAGGGLWYTKTLNMLQKGNRVWVNKPGFGYLGVGEVTGPVVKAIDYRTNGKSLVELDTVTNYRTPYFLDNDDDDSEYLVAVKWIKTVEAKSAYSENGFFGNQNTVCKPRTTKWSHTVNRLKAVWNIST